MKDRTAMTAEATDTPDSDATAERSYFRVQIDAPIQDVWATLTRTDAVLPFLL